MNSSELNSYQNLFNAWREELSSKDITALNLNFIKSYRQVIENFTLENSNQTFVNEIFIKRMNFLIQNLIDLRKNKILNSILEKKAITTSYLSKQELLFYDYLKNAENILQSNSIIFSDQIKEYLNQNSNILRENYLEQNEETVEQNEETVDQNSSKDSAISENEITVTLLKDLDEFIYLNNKRYGPFKKNEIVEVPRDVFNKILEPKKIAKLKN